MSRLYDTAEWLRRIAVAVLFLCAAALLAVPVAIPYGVEGWRFGAAALACFWAAVLLRRQEPYVNPREMPADEI